MAPVERCTNHTFELAERLCGDCGRPFCGNCLVAPFRKRPPLCHTCAVAAAGVRNGARTAPVRSRKEIKALEREMRMGQAATRRPDAPEGDRGFGPARPSFSSGPSRPPLSRANGSERKAAEQQPGRAVDGEPGKADGNAPGNAARNRPLRGLVR